MALQPRRAKTDWGGCCQMTAQGSLWLAKHFSLNLYFSFLNWISLLLIQVATQLSLRGWVNPVPDPTLPEKFLGYSRESNLGPFGWQSDVLTTIPNRRSVLMKEEYFCTLQFHINVVPLWIEPCQKYWTISITLYPTLVYIVQTSGDSCFFRYVGWTCTRKWNE